MDRELDPALQNILNNAQNQHGSSSFFTQTAERPHSGLSQRGFSAGARPNDFPQKYEQLRLADNDIPSSVDEFDRNILRFDESTRQHQAEQGRPRLSIAPRGVNYEPSSHSSTSQPFIQPFSMPGPNSMLGSNTRPSRQQIMPSQPLPQPLKLVERGGPDPTAMFHGVNRYRLLQSAPQQPTPPFSLSGFAFTPLNTQAPAAQSSPPDQSSPSALIKQRRTSHQAPANRNQMSVSTNMRDKHLEKEMDNFEAPHPPVTPKRQTAVAPRNRLPQTLALGHAPPIVQGIQLVSPHELPDRFRQVFPYPLFNAVQSKCFPFVFQTNDNVVVSAPTGSGKTVILELAICKVVEGFDATRVKIIYLAPTKSLCAERARDWDKKFRSVGLPCSALTGDTDSSEMKKVGEAVIIVTTPEKWDSITRKWKDHARLLEMVKLILVDEVHILKDTRGATLEAVVSRMKSNGANVRFVALSATVPNSQDIATWLGRDHDSGHLPAHKEIFGEDFRPVKLQKHIHGFEGGSNDYAFDSILDKKLPDLISKYTHRKPMMVFSFTRKFCEKTAQNLAEWWGKCRDNDRAWPAPTKKLVTTNKLLNSLLSSGVAFHHAGLDANDRAVIEKGFLEGDIFVICCTSTLAVGVNLPCHLVVIKNTVGFQDGGALKEYSDLEVMQMLGRAGRPQFDDSAIAIIMTRNEKVDRYKKMISGQELLESTLHLNLIEHLNSEIGLGTIKNVHSAKRWLSSTFLAVRIRQNPTHYKFDGVVNTRDVDKKLEQVCERDINLLLQTKLIADNGNLSTTEYGEAMSRYMVRFETMKLLLGIPEHAKMSQILHTISQASEFNDQYRIKANERAVFKKLNKSPTIKWPVKGTVSTTTHKVFIMVQAELAGVEMPNDKDLSLNRQQYTSEKRLIFEQVQRLLKCFIDCRAYDCNATSTRYGLELIRSITAECWEKTPMQLRQIQGIGPVAMRRFVGADITNIDMLRNTDPEKIERLLSKNPPYGRRMRDTLSSFPKLTLKAEFMRSVLIKQGEPVKMIVKAQLGLATAKASYWNHKQVTVTFLAEVSDGTLVKIWRGSLHMLERVAELKFDAFISTSEDTVICTLACDEIVGTVREVVLKPNLPTNSFPKPKPKTVQQKTAVDPQSITHETTKDDEFGSDDIPDSELVAATEKVETSNNRASTYHADDYEDIDSFDSPKASSKRPKNKDKEHGKDFERMKNGKWKCNHECADGAPTKSGGPCKHACCRDGLDKPRKRSAPRKKDTSHDNKSGDEKPISKTSPKNSKKKGSESQLRIASKEDQERQRKEPTEIVDLADRPGTLHSYYDPRGDKSQVKSSARIPKSTPGFSCASGDQPDLPFLHKKDKARNPNAFDEENEFGSEHSDDFDLPTLAQLTNQPTLSQLSKGRLEVVSPNPKAASTSMTHENHDDHDQSGRSLHTGTIGVPNSAQAPVQTSSDDADVDMPDSFEKDCFDFDAFDNEDYDYLLEETSGPQKTFSVDPHHRLSSADGNSSSSSGKRQAPGPTEETPVVKHRRVTQEPPKEVTQSNAKADADADADAPEPDQKHAPITQAEDGEWITLTYGGNNVTVRKKNGNRDGLPRWVMTDVPPDVYEEYGDFVDFI